MVDILRRSRYAVLQLRREKLGFGIEGAHPDTSNERLDAENQPRQESLLGINT